MNTGTGTRASDHTWDGVKRQRLDESDSFASSGFKSDRTKGTVKFERKTPDLAKIQRASGKSEVIDLDGNSNHGSLLGSADVKWKRKKIYDEKLYDPRSGKLPEIDI